MPNCFFILRLRFDAYKGLLQCDKNIYLFSTVGCIAGLVIIYTIIYLITSKAYYRIVKR